MIERNQTLLLAVGPLRLALRCAQRELAAAIERRYAPFLTAGETDLELDLEPLSTALNSCRDVAAYQQTTRLAGAVLRIESPELVAHVDLDRGRGDLRVNPGHRGAVYLIENALRQICQVLAVLRGCFLMHSAAAQRRGAPSAQAFAGRSGAGKSTISGLLEQAGHGVLSDDLILLVPKGDETVVMATPFYGTLQPRQTIRNALSLTVVNFLEQSPAAASEPLRLRAAIVGSLLCNVPFSGCFDRAHQQRLLDSITRVAVATPARRLRFCRDLSFLPLIGWRDTASEQRQMALTEMP